MNNFFDDLPNDLTTENFKQIVNSEHVVIERIVSKGHCSPEQGWYDQSRNEWVMVLQGHAVLLFDDGMETQLRKGDYVNIKPHQKHKVIYTDPDIETIWLAIHY